MSTAERGQPAGHVATVTEHGHDAGLRRTKFTCACRRLFVRPTREEAEAAWAEHVRAVTRGEE